MNEYNYKEYNVIEFEVNKGATEKLINVLKRIKRCGSIGASRAITVEGCEPVFFDGDGSDRIGDITVNGLHLQEIDRITQTNLDRDTEVEKDCEATQ